MNSNGITPFYNSPPQPPTNYFLWVSLGLLPLFLAFNAYLYLVKGIMVDYYSIFSDISNTGKPVPPTSSTSSTTTNDPTIPLAVKPTLNSEMIPTKNVTPENTLSKTLNNPKEESVSDYQADDSYSSSIQSTKTGSKSGWCFIGQDNGVRTCMEVSQDDTCMSGNIFPNKDICINPNLR